MCRHSPKQQPSVLQKQKRSWSNSCFSRFFVTLHSLNRFFLVEESKEGTFWMTYPTAASCRCTPYLSTQIRTQRILVRSAEKRDVSPKIKMRTRMNQQDKSTRIYNRRDTTYGLENGWTLNVLFPYNLHYEHVPVRLLARGHLCPSNTSSNAALREAILK